MSKKMDEDQRDNGESVVRQKAVMAGGGLSPARRSFEEEPKHPWRREFEKSIFSRV